MIVSESSRTRRLVGSLDPGGDLLLQLVEVCRSHRVQAGALRAHGSVEDPVVGARQLPGACEIVSLSGNVRAADGAVPTVQAWVTLAREGAHELIGGRLRGGRVIACEFVIDAFDDAPIEKAKPAVTFEAPARTSWSDVIAASGRHSDPTPPVRAVPPPVADAEPELPHSSDEAVNVRAGDLIDHPKFGRCAVERVDGDYEFVTARLRNQRLIRLSLDVLTLVPAGQADGKNLFRAVAGK